MEKSEIKLLPMVVRGVSGGLWKYFIKEPVRRGVESWVESHTEHLDELEKYIGEQALSLENIKPHLH